MIDFRKQSQPDDSRFRQTWEQAQELAPHLEARVDAALEALTAEARGRNAAVAWSGGKDSLVVAHLAAQLGITDGVLALYPTEMEHPAFESWCLANRPAGSVVHRAKRDLEWLASRPDLLFPQTGKLMRQWRGPCQWAGQKWYMRTSGADLLILGRRRGDGNVVKPGGPFPKSLPTVDWTHAEVMAYLQTRQIALPPIYAWPNGWKVGTGPWGKRRDVVDEQAGWRPLGSIDPAILRVAAGYFPRAADRLAEIGEAP